MNIRLRTSLLMATAVAGGVFLCGLFALHLLEQELTTGVFEGATLTATVAANGISTYLDDTLQDTRAASAHISVPALIRQDHKALVQSLRQIVDLNPKFDNGAWILAGDGTLLASTDPQSPLLGNSFAHRDYFRRTAQEKRGLIGQPYDSASHSEPVLTFTHPLLASDGNLLGVLACSIKLRSPLALGALGTLRYGETGYLFVVDRQRRILIHPDPSMVLKTVPAGSNQLFENTLAGQAGVGETVNSRGIRMLTAFKPVSGTDWLVGVQQPSAEALHPIKKARYWLLAGIPAAGILALLLGMLALRQMTRSLRGLQKTLDELLATSPDATATGYDHDGPLARLNRIPSGTELGHIAASFRTLYGQLDKNVGILRRATEEWEQTFDAVPVGIVILSRDNRLIKINQAAARMLELDRDQILGACCQNFLHREGCNREECPAMQIVRSGQGMRGELSFRGAEQMAEVITTPLVSSQGQVLGTVNILHDLKSQFHTAKRIEQLEQYDPVSGLPNRDKLRLILQEMLQFPEAGPHQVGVLLLDLDNFATVNDSLGHAAGDELIRAVASRLTSILGPGFPAARLGGDEFVVLMPILGAAEEEVAKLCQLLQHSFTDPFQIGEQSVFCSFSIGVALYPEHGLDPGGLLKSADIAMYHAKQHGRNTWRLYRRDMDSKALERLRLGTSLRHALDRNEFTLYYQPCIDLSSGQMVGVEALLRWHTIEFGDVPPQRFIPLAEESGLINAIGEWVMRTACFQGRAWYDAGLPLRIAINLSGIQFKQDELATQVEQVLRDSRLPGHLLELELTETVLMENPDAATELLETFKTLGIQIALDDFGTGYSSLSYLKRFPLDRLKIDRSFVQDMLEHADDASIVEVIISIAHTLGLQVTAEGIEIPEQLAFLRENGCQQGQGYLFSRPVPGSEIPALAANIYLELPSAS